MAGYFKTCTSVFKHAASAPELAAALVSRGVLRQALLAVGQPARVAPQVGRPTILRCSVEQCQRLHVLPRLHGTYPCSTLPPAPGSPRPPNLRLYFSEVALPLPSSMLPLFPLSIPVPP